MARYLAGSFSFRQSHLLKVHKHAKKKEWNEANIQPS